MHLPMILSVILLLSLSLGHSGIPPPLGISWNGPSSQNQQELLSSDSGLQTFCFNQTLDHFTFTPESYTSFPQRYLIDATHQHGPNAPILAFLGGESAFESYLSNVGFLLDNGPRLKALLVYIEHRFYGKSMPLGSPEKALKNASTLGYLTAPQALADYAAILLHVKDTYSSPHSPVIVIGGSYGGMLAAWFRLKYPHIAMGALASSAPLLYFQDTLPKHGYYYIVTKVFKETSLKCYNTIRGSWKVIDEVAAKPNGLSILSKKFKLCTDLNKSSELKDYLGMLYSEAVQYNQHSSSSSSKVVAICDAINNSPPSSKLDILGQILAGVVAYRGNSTCYYASSSHLSSDQIAWSWQSCSEIVIPIGQNKEDTMFETRPFNMSLRNETCESLYGVPPRPHWATTYFGIQDIKLILGRFGSNIIFSNVLWDPFSVGGVLEDISPTIVAVTTRYGSHCQDIVLKSEDDPEWLLLSRRDKEIEIIESWISTYYRDLRNLNISV